MPYLTRDIYSSVTSTLYGKAGDQVKTIGDHGEVHIVEGPNGVRFPVKSIYLTDSVNGVEKGEWKPEVNHVPAKKQVKKKQLVTQTLF